MMERVVRGEHDDAAKADSQGKEALRNSVVPDRRRQQFFPSRSDEVQDTGDGAVQCDRMYEKHNEDYVGEYRQEVRRFAGTPYTSYYYEEYEQPAYEERDRQTPIWHADAVVDVTLLSQYLLATRDCLWLYLVSCSRLYSDRCK